MQFEFIARIFRTHRRWAELADSALSGELLPVDEQALRDHATGCDACAARLREHGAIRNALQTTLPEAAVPRSFALTPGMVDEPEETASRPGWLSRSGRGTAVALQGAAAALFIVFGVALAATQLPDDGVGGDDADGAADMGTMAEEPAGERSNGGNDAGIAEEEAVPGSDGADEDAGPGPVAEDAAEEGNAGAESAPPADDAAPAPEPAEPTSGSLTQQVPPQEADGAQDQWQSIALVLLGSAALGTAFLALAVRMEQRRHP